MPAIHVAQLFIYPIKSCYGIELQSAELCPEGLDLDRRWVLIDADNKFLTIRQIPQMTRIRPCFSDDGSELIIKIPDEHEALVSVTRVPTRPARAQLETDATLQAVTIWKDAPEAWVYPAAITKKLSAFLEQPVRLAYKGPGAGNRVLPGASAASVLGHPTGVGFADFLPVQIASLASLADLNRQLQESQTVDERTPLTIKRYRPNIVVAGDDLVPWSEDNWGQVSIASSNGNDRLTLTVTEICRRCLVPNVDPETAHKNKHEPWDTTVRTRRVDPDYKFKPCFGTLAVPKPSDRSMGSNNAAMGMIRVGDAFTVEETVDRTAVEEDTAQPAEQVQQALQGFLSSLASRLFS